MDPTGLLADLTPDQRAAVTSEAGPLVVVAPAGSGKTRVLTRRIAHRIAVGSAHPLRILAVTFTRQAAAELGERLEALGVRDRVAAATLHSAALAQLRLRWLDLGRRPLTVLDRPARLVARVLPPSLSEVASAVAAEIAWAKATLLEPSSYAAGAAGGRIAPLPPGDVAEAWAAYEAEKRRVGVIDLDDVLIHCAEALETDPTFAAAQRWRFRHLFVDEAQDLTPAQWRLIRAWQGGRADLFLVGDPHQSIYGWSGAHAGVLLDPGSHVPGATVLHLTHNHRCRPDIVAAASAVLGSEASGLGVSVTATRPPADAPRLAGSESEELEARAVAGQLADALRRGRRPTDLAVLARTHARLVATADACNELHVPVTRPGAARRWASRPEIAAVLDDLATAPARMDLAGALSRTRHDLTHVEEAVEEVSALVGEYLALEPAGDLRGFTSWLDTCEPPPPGGAVTLSTFHGAKGREFPSVWVTGVGAMSGEPEELRLLHVALSRAVDELTVTWSGPRPPVVDAIEAAVSRAEPHPVDWRAELNEVRARLREVTAAAKG